MESVLSWLLYGFLGLVAGLLPVGLMALRTAHLKSPTTLPLKLMPQTLLDIGEKKSAYIVMAVQLFYSLLIFSFLPVHASHIGFVLGCQIQSARPFQTQLSLIPLLAYIVGHSTSAWVPLLLFIGAFIFKPVSFKTATLALFIFAPVWLTVTVSTATGLISLAIALMMLGMHKNELITA